MGSLIVTAILRGGLYALMAIGLSVVYGVMNISNFAHGEYYMLGAYFAYFAYSTFGLSPLLAMLFGAICGFVVGVITEKLIFTPLRKRSEKNWVMNTFLLTLGLSLILKNGAKVIWGNTYRGITSYFNGQVDFGIVTVSTDRIVALVIAVVSITAFMLFMNYTRTGRAIRAVSMDSTGASIVGVNLGGIYTLTMGLSAALAALAGGALLSITPANPEMGMAPLYKSWFVLILIGMGNIGGSIVGGLIVGALEAASTYFIGASWQDVFSLSIIILILLIKPNGIFGKNTKKV